ncbi:MAG: hypothetical protein JXR77_03775 [Lentisphaeria bacterium]|nr:hypothetical protein [Lentisphaeria bacterium]
MTSRMKSILGIVTVAAVGSVTTLGCRPKSDSESSGVGQRTGAAIDRATEKTVDTANTVADKTVDAAKATMTATKDVAGAVVEKTGEVLEKAGTAVEKTGAGMQK